MPVRFDAATDRLLITTSPIDYNAAYTWMAWIYVSTDNGGYNSIMALDTNSGTTTADEIGVNMTGSSNRWFMWIAAAAGSTVEEAGTGTVATGTWYHMAVVRESLTLIKLYVNGTLTLSGTRDVTGRASATRMEMGAAESANNDVFSGRVCAIKAWSAALTLNQVNQEMNSIRPVEFVSLYGFWPTWPGSGERAADYSGNGNNWTEGGTLTDEDPPPVSWGAAVWMPPFTAPAGGTQYTSTVDGTLTSSGALVNQTGKVLAGALTDSGALVKQTGKVLAGALTDSGALVKQTGKVLAGALTDSGALLRQFGRSLVGTLTDSGALSRQIGKVLAGALTDSGALVKQTSKLLAGALTSSGALATTKAALLSLAGALTSSGALAKQTSKVLAGALTDSGALVKQTSKLLAGALTDSGALTMTKVALLSLAGALTSSGALVKQTSKVLAGVLTDSGALVKQTGKVLAGTLTDSGVVLRQFGRVLAGTLTSSGALVKQTGRQLAGALTSAGALTKRTATALVGALTNAGALINQYFPGGFLAKAIPLTLALRSTWLTIRARLLGLTVPVHATRAVTLGSRPLLRTLPSRSLFLTVPVRPEPT